MKHKSLNWTSSQILACRSYLELFGDVDPKLTYRLLLKRWHPDHSKSNTEDVFVYITQMFSKSSIPKSSININGIDINAAYQISNSLYHMCYDAVSQSFYIKFFNASEKLSKNYVANLNSLKKLLNGHALESRYSEMLSSKLLEKDGLFKISIPKGFVPLSLLINFIIDYKDYKISAYIISRLWDQAMMYSNVGLMYVGADPNFIFVNTESHKILDLSGLFFSVEKNTNLIALTSYQAPSVIKSDISNKQISNKSVASLIVNLGYNLAGDINKTSNVNLLDKDAVCIDMIKSLSSFNLSDDISHLYKYWQTESVKSIFKERSFYKKEVTFNDLIPYIV